MLAASVAISGSSQNAEGFTGAGAFAFNEISLDICATIDGGSAPRIASAGVSVAAADTSLISSTVFAGSVAGGFSSQNATTVAIGVSFARNSITDPVTAYIKNVPLLTTGGGAVSVTATEHATINAISAAVAIGVGIGGQNGLAVGGGGALAANFIDATAQAYISGSTLGNATSKVGAVTVTANDSSSINATIAAIAAAAGIGGTDGTAVAIGIALAYNEIGDATGFGQGAVKAYIAGSSVAANGLVDVEAHSTGTIEATTVAVAAALSGGGTSGIAVAGGGVGVFNTVSVAISAYIDGGGSKSVSSGGVTVAASDTANISSLSAAAALSASLAGTRAVGVAIGLSIAGNIITDPVTAYVSGVTSLTSAGKLVSVTAQENATIKAKSYRGGGRLRHRRDHGRRRLRRRRDGGKPDRRDDLSLYRQFHADHGRRGHSDGDRQFRHRGQCRLAGGERRARRRQRRRRRAGHRLRT